MRIEKWQKQLEQWVTVAMVYDELHLDWVQFASYLWLAIVLQARSGDFASAASEFTFSREKR